MSQQPISISTPGANTTVGTNFTATGTVSPASSSVSVTFNGTAGYFVSVAGTVAGSGSWHANFAGIHPGVGTLNACITGGKGPGPCASETITVH